jgi:hypothetical protein
MSDSFTVPQGVGFRRIHVPELKLRQDLFGTLQIWEHPRKRGPRRYILGIDVADGVGLDRSVIAVHRQGTLEDEEEQVALYVNDTVTPGQFAYIVDAVMGLYTDEDGYEAMAAIECNNHGLSVQDTLQLHLSRSHFYRWEYLDAADPSHRYSTKIGWVTTPRTRPMLLDKLYTALTTIDPITHRTELLVHSKMLFDELADFQTEGALWEAEAARGAHDDLVLATAIAHYISFRLHGGEQEPLSERRARLHAERAARAASGPVGVAKRDWRSTGCTADEWKAGVDPDEVQDNLYDSERGAPFFLP